MVAVPELKVLVVEDNPADAHRVREALRDGGHGRFQPSFVGGLRDAEARLAGADIVLLDLSLPDSSGADTVARIREKAPGTPVVVLSGERDEAMAFRCLQHGAQDVLLKGALDSDALVRALTCALERQALARERDEALRRARVGEAELRGLLDSVKEGIVIADPKGRILLVNPAAELLLGWTEGQAVGKSLDIPVEVGKVLDSGRVGLDGQPSVIEARTATIRWEGRPATLTSIHEIERHRRREPRRQDRQRGRLDDRNGAEHRETLRRLATGISRGLGEPLAAVLEGAFELSEGPDAAAYGPALKIQRAAWRAAGLVRQLQAGAGEAKAAPEPVDLGEFVSSHWDRVEEHRTEGITVEKDLATGLPLVLADRRLLEMAFLCLVEHARASVADGGTVTIRAALEGASPGSTGFPSSEGRTRVALSVADTGPWLGLGACQRIFEPFYSTDVLGIGTGIGLAPVLGIALQCGGIADVRSVPGLGTTVRILLPAMDEDQGPDPATLVIEEEAPGPLPRGKETILLAEGNSWLRWRIYSTLQPLGYRILSAACVGDAVRLATDFKGPIHLLLTEARATGMGGSVLAGVLRCQRPGVRALLLTDSAGENPPALSPQPSLRFLAFPFRPSEIAVAVRSLLDVPAEGSVTQER